MPTSSRDDRFLTEFHTGPISLPKKLSGLERIRAAMGHLLIAEQRNDSFGHDQYLATIAYLDYVAARLGNPYAAPEQFQVPPTWPWSRDDWKPAQSISDNLARAGALIAVSLDSMD